MNFIINPGTGPVDGATVDHAYANMQKLLDDAGLRGARFTRDAEADERSGRFAFKVAVPGGERFGMIDVDMPGIPLERVRFTGADGQNIWHFPRLYVDGSSWVWKYAVNIMRNWLGECEAAEEERRVELLEIRREREGEDRTDSATNGGNRG